MSKNDSYRQGNERKIRLNDDLLWGIHPVYEALSKEPERITEVIVVKDRKGGKREEIIEKTKDAGIKISFVTSLRLIGDESSQVRHQGVIAKISQTELINGVILKVKYPFNIGLQ